MNFLNRGGSDGPFTLPTNGGLGLPAGLHRIWKWGLGLIGLVLLIVLLFIGKGIYTDWLWFNNLGYLDVFKTILLTKLWIFLASASIFAVLISVNLAVAVKLSAGANNLPIPPEAIRLMRRLMRLGLILAIIVISFIFGALASGQWETFLLFINGTSFEIQDPLFNLDVSFYAFTLPFLNWLQGLLLGAVIVILVASILIYVINTVLSGTGFSLKRPIKTHLAILGAIIMLTLVWNHYLDIYELVFSDRGATFGASYADVNARIPALRILMVVAGASSVLMLISIAVREPRGIRLAIGAFALWAVAAIVVGNFYPTMIQRLTVNPDELSRETIYIKRNIDFTRQAFALDRITETTYPVRGEITKEIIDRNPGTINNIRLWDQSPIKDVYNQIQVIRLYYDFLGVDIDRYSIGGETRQVMLSARELAPEKLPEEAQRWINSSLIYTHGYGLAVSPVNEFTSEGRPELLVQDIPPKHIDAADSLAITRPEIYYGEAKDGYVIVNSKTKEFDYPTEKDIPAYTSYQGTGGVHVGSLLRRAAYAWQFADINVLISNQIKAGSRIQYRRDIQERVEQVAPFLTLDHDPYLVIDKGQMMWMQDAYTIMNNYPYSTPSQGQNGDFNYIRNSVKIIINAYDGSMVFYIADESDPLIQSYKQIFPELFISMSEMAPSLREHIRYPEDFFSIQAGTYLQYHMKDPTVFFNKEDQWSIPQEVYFGSPQAMEPYYVIMKLPHHQEEEFVLILPFTPSNKPNLVAWLAARNDGENYGKLQAFFFPRDRQMDGPSQVEARIDNDPTISAQFTLWGQAGSTVIRGNLLVIPMEESLLYVEPVYLQAESLAYPELKRVIVVSSNNVIMAESLSEALSSLTGDYSPIEPISSLPGNAMKEASPEGSIEEILDQVGEIAATVGNLKTSLSQLEGLLKRLREMANGDDQ
jgi:uncharacterized membrane protein (UPF0182 family)